MKHAETEQPEPAPYRVGDAIVFVPSAFIDYHDPAVAPYSVAGRVIHVNAAHRHYTAAGMVHGVEIRESYKY